MYPYFQLNDENNDEDTLAQLRREQQRQKQKRSALTLFLTILFMTYTFLVGSYYSFYYPHGYKQVFQEIQISSEYDSDHETTRLLPLIKVNFVNKNLQLTHHVVVAEKQNSSKTGSSGWFRKMWILFDAWSSRNFLDFDYNEKEQQLKIEQHRNNKYHFKVLKLPMLKVNEPLVECFNFSVKSNEVKHFEDEDDEIEVCFTLNGNSWYGGHE
jgi:hypothetical protein